MGGNLQLTLTPLCSQERVETRERQIMARNTSIYVRPFDLQNHKYNKLYHKGTLGFKEDERHNLSKEKIENFCMELRLAGQELYWYEVMNNSNNSDNVYNPPEWKYVKCDQDKPMHQKSKTYHWRHNHNYRNFMRVVHLRDEYKASDEPKARFQKPAKSKYKNQTAA